MKYNDYELLDLIYEEDEVAYNIMLSKYKPIIYNKALEYYTYLKNNNYKGYTFDDFYEEGLIAFNRAIKCFDPYKGNLFYSFLLVCLTSNFNLLCRNIFRLKHKPLLTYQEIDYEIRDSTAIDPYVSIEEFYLNKKIKEYLYSINFIDAAIIELRLNNFKYQEISELLEIDNTRISRVIKTMKTKFKPIISE